MRDDIFKVSGTTARQRARWREAAGGGPRDLSAWIRAAADSAAADPASVQAVRVTTDALVEAIVDLRGALGSGPGNAINQVARALNTDIRGGRAPNAPPHEQALADAYAEIQAIRGALNLALDQLAELRP